MYAHITTFRLRPGTMEETRRLMERELVPWLRGREGFHGFHLARISDTEAVAFGVWGDRRVAEASKDDHDRMIQQTLKHLFAAPPEYREGEVEVHAAGHAPHPAV